MNIRVKLSLEIKFMQASVLKNLERNSIRKECRFDIANSERGWNVFYKLKKKAN